LALSAALFSATRTLGRRMSNIGSKKPSRNGRMVELVSLFGVLPIMLYFIRLHVAFLVLPLLIVASTGCLAVLWKDRNFKNERLWRTRHLSGHLKKILISFTLAAAFFTLITYLFAYDHFLFLIRSHPYGWLLTLLSYPVLCAYTQEVIFRGFFFHRYRALFPNTGAMLFINGICFGMFHIFYGNWFSPLLTSIGGMIFGYRYLKSGSLLPAAIEHALYGTFLFTIGLGWYFYSGSIT
jgi:CAAX protease family protein